MTDKEIREAVEVFECFLKYDSLFGDYEKEVLPVLLKLAQSYLSIEGFPEEKDTTSERHATNWQSAGYNQALKECKLALMKKFNVERIEEVCKWAFERHPGVSPKQLAQAIHKLLTEERNGHE